MKTNQIKICNKKKTGHSEIQFFFQDSQVLNQSDARIYYPPAKRGFQ